MKQKNKLIDLEKGETENKDYMRCRQTKCSFFINGGCRPCDNCRIKEFILSKDCERCNACSNIEGELRWGNKNINNKEAVKKPLKIVLMEGDKPIAIIGEESQQEKPRQEKELIMR